MNELLMGIVERLREQDLTKVLSADQLQAGNPVPNWWQRPGVDLRFDNNIPEKFR